MGFFAKNVGCKTGLERPIQPPDFQTPETNETKIIPTIVSPPAPHLHIYTEMTTKSQPPKPKRIDFVPDHEVVTNVRMRVLETRAPVLQATITMRSSLKKTELYRNPLPSRDEEDDGLKFEESRVSGYEADSDISGLGLDDGEGIALLGGNLAGWGSSVSVADTLEMARRKYRSKVVKDLKEVKGAKATFLGKLFRKDASKWSW